MAITIYIVIVKATRTVKRDVKFWSVMQKLGNGGRKLKAEGKTNTGSPEN